MSLKFPSISVKTLTLLLVVIATLASLAIATLLYSQLTQKGTPAQRAAVQHNIGNMFFLKALQVSGGNDPKVRDEVEYLLMQAHSSYKQALKQDNSNWGTRRNLDRVITLLPENPTPGVGESDSPGLIMGNIPNGLP